MSKTLKAQYYLFAAHAGAALMVALGLAYALDVADFFKGLIVGILLVLIAILFRSKLRDEYIERLWNAGTAAAFVTTLTLTLLADVVRGFASEPLDMATVPPAMSSLTIGFAALVAFYVGFHLAMLRERS